MTNLLMKSAIAAALIAAAGGSAYAGSTYAGGAFGNYYYSDGSQERLSRVIAGAAPNARATFNGVRCSYQYIVRNGVRERYEVCN